MINVLGVGCLITILSSYGYASASADLEYVDIYKAKPGRSAMYAQITKLRDGSLLCNFRDSKIDETCEFGDKRSPWTVPGSKIVSIRSSDNGRTWSDTPSFVYQDKDSSSYTCLGRGYQTKDGTILVPFYVVTMTGEGLAMHIHWNFMAASHDNGRTWWCQNLPSSPFLTNPIYGGITQANDGSLWMVERCRGYQISLDDAYIKKQSWLEVRSCVRIVESRDDGQTWEPSFYVGYDPTRPEETRHFPVEFKEDEPAVIQLPSGKIILMARPYLYRAVSEDKGQTWTIGPSNLTKSGGEMSGLCPAMCYFKSGLPKGILMLAYHDRWGEHSNKGGLYFSFSYDEGETWGYPTFIDGGAYPCLCGMKEESGEFLCSYYRSSSLLKGVFFSIPFPTGIRAMADSSSITVKWDHYRGKDAEAYEYRVYRSEKPDFALTQETLIFSQRNISSYHDKGVETGRTYYYRVGVYMDGKTVGRSWQVSAIAGVSSSDSAED